MSRVLTLALAATLGLAAPSAASAAGFGLNSLYGCDAAGSKDTTGAVVGGLVGALAGSQISKNERGLGAVIGAGIGAAIGNNIGCRMDRKARQDAQTAFQQALDTGRAQSWSDPQTGASGSIRVIASAERPSPPPARIGAWRFAQGIAPAVRASSVGGAYAASNRVNVRAAPNAGAQVVDRLRPGEEVTIGGAVAGGWLAVVEDGYIQGYVARSAMRPTDGDGGGCRLVEQTVDEPGQAPYRERFNACRDAAGTWQLETV